MPALAIRPAILPRRLLREARRYAPLAATVLITGETGVGKNALARYLHASGPRHSQPFLTVDCAALPATLVDAEFLGHERGAFTDALVARAGRFEQAGHGTLYLDAITSLSTAGQGALLRVIEEKQVTRLGGTSTIDVHARIIASADARIAEHVATGSLRSDLYHRLNILPMPIPPLRDRRGDIAPLARHFIAAIAAQQQRAAPTLTEQAVDALLRYDWPGNVRELRYVIERVLLNAAGERIDVHHLPDDVLEEQGVYEDTPLGQPPTLAEVERRYIAVTLQLARGNQTRAAAMLGISRKALWEKRKRFALE